MSPPDSDGISMVQKKLYQPHYSNAKDARILQTRRALQQSFMKLLAAKPLEKITIREIAASAGVGYNTFFRHYTDKDSLLNEMAIGEISDLIELSMSVLDGSDSLQASLALCRYVDDHDALWSTLLNGGAAGTLRDAFINRLRETAGGRINSTQSYPAEIGVKLVAAGTIEILSWWLQHEPRIAVEEIADIYDQLVVRPIVKVYKSGQ
jgi:AcrR family transcriptional regulator